MTKDREEVENMETGRAERTRLPYEAPRLTRKRSLARAVLFSGGATTGTTGASATATGLTGPD